MDYKSMVELAKKTNINLNPAEKIALSSKSAVKIIDDNMRWLENGEEISFETPHFTRFNAEFSIKDRPYQKIWFSQLSSIGVTEDLETPLLDEIIFKGEPVCTISKYFKSATQFWDAIRDKRFRVEIIARGFIINKDHCFPSSIKSHSDKLKYIRNAVRTGNERMVMGALKNKTVYRLIEI